MSMMPENTITLDRFIQSLEASLDQKQYHDTLTLFKMMNISLITKAEQFHLQQIISFLIQLLEALIAEKKFTDANQLITDLHSSGSNNALSTQCGIAFVKLVNRLYKSEAWPQTSIRLLLLQITCEKAKTEFTTNLMAWQTQYRSIIQYYCYAYKVLTHCKTNVETLEWEMLCTEKEINSYLQIEFKELKQQMLHVFTQARKNNIRTFADHFRQVGMTQVTKLVTDNQFNLAAQLTQWLQAQLDVASKEWKMDEGIQKLSDEFMQFRLSIITQSQCPSALSSLVDSKRSSLWLSYREILRGIREKFIENLVDIQQSQIRLSKKLIGFIKTLLHDAEQVFNDNKPAGFSMCVVVNGSLARKAAGPFSDIEYMVLLNNCSSFAFSKLKLEEFTALKKLLDPYFPTISAINVQHTDYKAIAFTNEEVSAVKKKLGKINTEEAKTLSMKLVDNRRYVEYVLTLFTLNVTAIGESLEILEGFGKVPEHLAVRCGFGIDSSGDPIESQNKYEKYVGTPQEIVTKCFPDKDDLTNRGSFSSLIAANVYGDSILFKEYQALVEQALSRPFGTQNQLSFSHAIVLERLQEQCETLDRTIGFYRQILDGKVSSFDIKEHLVTPLTLIILLWGLWKKLPLAQSYYPPNIIDMLCSDQTLPIHEDTKNHPSILVLPVSTPFLTPDFAGELKDAFLTLERIRFRVHSHPRVQSSKNDMHWRAAKDDPLALTSQEQQQIHTIIQCVFIPLYSALRDFLVNPHAYWGIDVALPMAFVYQQLDNPHHKTEDDVKEGWLKQQQINTEGQAGPDLMQWIRSELLMELPPLAQHITWADLLEGLFHTFFKRYPQSEVCQNALSKQLKKLLPPWRKQFIENLKNYLQKNPPAFFTPSQTEAIGKWISNFCQPLSHQSASFNAHELFYHFTLFIDARRYKLPRASLKGMNLSHFYYVGTQVFKTKASFAEVYLRHADLQHTLAIGTSFQSAKLAYAKLNHANHTKACYENAELCHVEADEVNFTDARFHGADLSNSKFHRTCFYGADLTHVRFDKAELKEANLSNANISYGQGLTVAALQWATLDKTIAIDAKIKTFNTKEKTMLENWGATHKLIVKSKQLLLLLQEDKDLSDINMSNLTLSGTEKNPIKIIGRFLKAKFRKVAMDHVKIDRSNFSQADLRGARFYQVNFSNSVVKNVNFSAAEALQEVNLAGTDLSGSCFSGVNLLTVNLEQANLTSVDLSGALGVNKIAGANLKGANLQKVDLRQVDFSEINLQDADLREAMLIKTDGSLVDITQAKEIKGCLLPTQYLHALEDKVEEEKKQLNAEHPYQVLYNKLKVKNVPIDQSTRQKKAEKFDKKWQARAKHQPEQTSTTLPPPSFPVIKQGTTEPSPQDQTSISNQPVSNENNQTMQEAKLHQKTAQQANATPFAAIPSSLPQAKQVPSAQAIPITSQPMQSSSPPPQKNTTAQPSVPKPPSVAYESNWATLFRSAPSEQQAQALHQAIAEENMEKIIYFLSLNYTNFFTYKDDIGQSILHVAVLTKSEKIVSLLLECTRTNKIPDSIINQGDQEGQTPLHLAVLHRSPNIKNLLLNYGAKIDQPNADGLTPHDLWCLKK